MQDVPVPTFTPLHRRSRAVAVFAATAVFAGCSDDRNPEATEQVGILGDALAGSDRGRPAPGVASRIVMTNFAFEPDADTFAAGSQITLVNESISIHNLVFEATEADSGPVDGGQSSSFVVPDLPPGTHTIVCTIFGHQSAGMELDIVVS